MIDIKKTIVGALQTNCYIIKDVSTGEFAVIDPGASSNLLKSLIDIQGNKIKYILLTHAHFDHMGYAEKIKSKTNAEIALSKYDEPLLTDCDLNLSVPFMGIPTPYTKADILLNDGDTLILGETEIKFILTAGHTKGSGCFIIDNNIFTGDTLMKLARGRTDFPTSSDYDMEKSLKKLAELDDCYNVYPGHGNLSSLKYEKNHNPFIRQVI